MTDLTPDSVMELAGILDVLGCGDALREVWATEAPKLLAMAIAATSGARDELDFYRSAPNRQRWHFKGRGIIDGWDSYIWHCWVDIEGTQHEGICSVPVAVFWPQGAAA